MGTDGKRVEIFRKWKNGTSLVEIQNAYGEFGAYIIQCCKENIENNFLIQEIDLDEKTPLPVTSELKKQIIKDFIEGKNLEYIKKTYGEFGEFVIEVYKKKYRCHFY